MNFKPPRLDPGCTIGPYVVDRPLARQDDRRGGLYLAHGAANSPLAGKPAVVRVIPAALHSGPQHKRFVREARGLAALDHDAIARVYGAGSFAGGSWIATEYVRGTDLERTVRERGSLSPEKALRWIELAADAMAAAHGAGVVHRDLGPSSLISVGDGRLKIVDFGRPSAGDMPPNAAYVSPEQLEHGLADERSDVWSLGCVLYELCVGSPPFGRGSAASLAARILRHEPTYPPYLPANVVHIVSACLRKSSFARVASARDLAALVRRALEGGYVEIQAPRAPSWPEVPTTYSSCPAAPPSDVAPRSTTIPPRSSDRPRPIARTGRLKGAAVRAALAWHASTYGEHTLRAAYRRASPELRAHLHDGDAALGVIPSGWYDTLCIGELFELLEETAASDEPNAYPEALASAIARDNVHGIYRPLFGLVATPAMLEANGHRVWRTYFDEGTLSARFPRNGELSVEVRHWIRHHPAVCRVVRFLLQASLREVGYRGLVVERTACVGDGDEACAFEGVYLP